jgi:hypothetical protein
MISDRIWRRYTYGLRSFPVYIVHNISDEGPGMQRDNSMLTFETSAVQGVAAIIEKLTVSLKQS